nr:PREDICTED: uncharacterized protein LOC100563185 [Anolis carolinensis]|eukprot:XP_003230159.1 PREDICTED: uncharacterized protein LOC100563185 [Anolis carolinensis]
MDQGSPAGAQSLHQSVGLLAISAGALLLLVHFYSFTRPVPLLSETALGTLLLFLSCLIGYAGIRKSLQNASIFVTLCLTISVLWASYGAIQVLAGQGLLHDATGVRNATIPGLVAFSLALLLVALVGFLQREAILAAVAFSLSLACAHEVASFYDAAFGSAGSACGCLAVCLVGGYAGLGRVFFFLSKGDVVLPGTNLAERGAKEGSNAVTNDLVPFGLILNLLSASVFGCRLLGVTAELSLGQVPWLWAGGLCQLGISISCYRTGDALLAIFSSFTAILKFVAGYSLLVLLYVPEVPTFPIPFFVAFALLFAVLAIFLALESLVDGVYLLFYVAWCIALASSPHGFFDSGPQGVSVAIFVASALMALVHLYNRKASVRIPQGERLLKSRLSGLGAVKFWEGEASHAPYLGYSKYADAEALGYAGSTLASFAITMTVGWTSPLSTVVIPCVVVAGGAVKLLCAFVAFSRGKTLESGIFILYGCFWVIWGLARYGGFYGTAHGGAHVPMTLVSLLVLNAFLACGTLFLALSWFALVLAFELIILSFLLDALGALPAGYDIAVTIVFGLVSFYGFLSAMVNGTFERPQLPIGRPILKLRGFGGGSPQCPHLPARKASSVKQVAEIMKQGGACGIPTDTVYVLAAACNRPDAVEKAYNTKRQAEDRPMSLWISSLKQLEPVKRLFSPILWDFMEAAWASPISLVIPRGEWLDYLGLKDSAKYVGTPQSIAIRIPDCSVTTHLIDLVGPITVTSANPTGEADTTHHNQVFAKLGNKVDAVLCAGPSPENIASTVVDCTKIESGNIGFFRVGIVPKTQVLQIFEQVQKKHQLGPVSNGTTAMEDSTEDPPKGMNGSHVSVEAPIEANGTCHPEEAGSSS